MPEFKNQPFSACCRRRRVRSLNRRGYTIASLLLLTATVAVVLALAGSMVREARRVDEDLVALNSILGAIGGGMIGAGLGALSHRRVIGFLSGGVVGCLAGGAAGILTAGPMNWPLALFGSGLLLALSGGVRFIERQPPVAPSMPPDLVESVVVDTPPEGNDTESA